MTRNPETTEAAKAVLEAAGYVVVKAKSYEAAQRRQGIADSQRQWAIEDRDHTRRWAEAAFDEQRRLSDRLTFVYGVARARGATVEELSGPAAVLAVSPAVTEGEREPCDHPYCGPLRCERYDDPAPSPAVTAAEDEPPEHAYMAGAHMRCKRCGGKPKQHAVFPAPVVAAVPADPNSED